MFRKLFRFLFILLFLAIAGGSIFYYRQPLREFTAPYANRFLRNLDYQLDAIRPACEEPITLSLGELDGRFGMNEVQISSAVNEAIGIWSEAAGKELFAYSPDSGKVRLNFIYDYRQETTDKLKEMGIVVDGGQKSYDQMKARYDRLQAQYESQKTEVELASQVVDSKRASYESEVAKWNDRGGAPENVYGRLEEQKAALQAETATVNSKIAKFNETVKELNALAAGLNKLAEELNLNVEKYNSIGEAVEDQFQAGVYIQDESGRRIEVYEFADRAQLVRLLAHELGHALGLEHTPGENDMMYYLNEAGNDALTPNDLAALKNACGIE